MPRIRTIKAEFFTNEELGACSMAARLLAIGLLNHADSAGRLEDRPARLKVLLFPFDEVNIDALLIELADVGYLIRYTGEGKRCLQIVNFIKHQRPHPKEPPSCLPAPAVKKNGKPCKKIQESSSSIIHYPSPDPSPDPSPRSPDPDPEAESEGKPVEAASPTFDEFYAEYPRHKARDDAERAWKKIPASELPRVLADVKHRKATEWAGKDPQYLPYPASYLNGKRWNDEIDRAPPQAGLNLTPKNRKLVEAIERETVNGNGKSRSSENPAQSIGHLDAPADGRRDAG